MASDTIRESLGARAEDERVPGHVDETNAEGFTLQTAGGVFDAAFDLYKRHFSTLALIVACVFIPTQVFLHAASNMWLRPLAVQINGANPDPFVVLQVSMLAFFIGVPQVGFPGYFSLLTSFMASGPVAVAVANILVGRPLSVGTAYRRAVPVFWRLFWMWNLLFVLFLLVFVVVFIGLFLGLMVIILSLTAAGLNANAIGAQELGVGFLILMIIIPYLTSCALGAVLFAFAPPLIGLENLTVIGAVERNGSLVSRKLFWRVCLAVTLLPIVTFGLQMLILGSASSVIEAVKWPAWAEFVANTGLSSLISFFFQPYWMIFLTLLYFDCRVRREGLDVRYLADNLPELDTFLAPTRLDMQAATSPSPGFQSRPGSTGPSEPGPALPPSPTAEGTTG